MKLRNSLRFGAIAGLVLALISTSSASALVAGGIGGRPANPDPKVPRTQSIFIMTLGQGESKTDRVRVVNNSGEKQTISLYAVDGQVTNTGSFTCKQEDDAKVDLGESIKLTESEVTLDTAKDVEVAFDVSMPDNADVGEHNGCIVFENKEDAGEATGNLRVKTRQALRVVAIVPGELKRDVSIDDFVVGQANGVQNLKLVTSNKGNVSADVDSTVTLTDIFGREHYKNGGTQPVLPNEALELNYTSDKQPLFGGWYYAQAKISYDKRAGTFGVASKSDLLTKKTEKKMVYLSPSPTGTVLIGLAILLIIGIIAATVLKKQRFNRAQRTWEEYEVQPGDTLESIATSRNIKWKKLAIINKRSAPYSIKSGETLKVPQKK